MYQRNNPSALHSREEIVRAFLLLLENKTLENITVKEIMIAADLSRQTFYQIFDSKDEIIEYYLDTVFQAFLCHTKEHTVCDLCSAAKLFFSFFESYRKPLSLFIRNGKSCVVQRKCREYLHQEQYIHYALHGVHSEQEQTYATTFIVSGMVAMLEQWLREDDAPDINQLALLICRITDTQHT